MKKSMKPLSAKALFASAAVAVAVFSATAPTTAYADYGSSGSLYYRIGGESPGGRANYESQVAAKLGLDATLRLSYSCGKFNIGWTWKAMINQLKQLGAKIQNALTFGIANLPMYILMRAQPGLYQLFQTYSAQADVLIAAALKTCEEFEAQIRKGENPYEDWIKLAKGEGWRGLINYRITTPFKTWSNSGQGDPDDDDAYNSENSVQVRRQKLDVYSAKEEVQKKEVGQKNGLPWVFGTNAGGVNQKPIQLPADILQAAYCTTLGLTAKCDEKESRTDKEGRLTDAFPTAESLINFVTEGVSGNVAFYTCTKPDCPDPTTTVTAVGLKRKAQDEYKEVQPILAELVSGTERGSAAYEKLKKISAPDFMVNGELLETLRRLPTEERAVAVERIARELAMQRVINKAEIASDVLITGLSLPAMTSIGKATEHAQATIDSIDQQVERLLRTHRTHQTMASNTAKAIMGYQYANEAEAASHAPVMHSDPNPLLPGGRVDK